MSDNNRTPDAMASIQQSVNRKEAVKKFLETYEKHMNRIEDTCRIVEQLYDFKTPDRPVIEFIIKGYGYVKSRWVSSCRCQ